MLDAITDIAGIRVGHWTDRRAATGCTAILCPTGTVGGVDVRGAAPGTRETDLLRPENSVQQVHGVLLTGGSAFGLEAASGVGRFLHEHGIGLEFGGHVIPIVPAAVIFDLPLGKPSWPDVTAGYRAAAAARGGRVIEGTVGAGTGATIAKGGGRERLLKGGVGTASERLDTGVIVGALVVVNAAGSIRDGRGRWVAAPRGDRPGTFLDPARLLRTGRRYPPPEETPEEDLNKPGGNTTIAVIATNARLTKAQGNRLATVAHDGFAHAIWPVHTHADGDATFALATGEVEGPPDGITALEAMAALAMSRAILKATAAATGLAGVPSAAEWRATAG
ncbi:MAG: peptidase S58 family protein [Dehalococcoidia bacterium]|nr:MAG: peptidase S58 family protein [Dehalococcoidia bacterium]